MPIARAGDDWPIAAVNDMLPHVLIKESIKQTCLPSVVTTDDDGDVRI